MTCAPQILLDHRLKSLRLPTVLREYSKLARQSAAEGLDHVQFLARLIELEMIDRERRMIERRIKAAKFPAVKSLDSFDFKAIPALNKMQVLELARCELVVTRIDRLARSIRDLQNIVYELKNKGVTLSATEQPIDTRTSAGKAFLDMLGVFSEFETNLRKERQMEGVRKAQERGVYKGRGRTIDASQIFELKQNGYGATKISKELGITRQSVYRLLKEQPVQSVSV